MGRSPFSEPDSDPSGVCEDAHLSRATDFPLSGEGLVSDRQDRNNISFGADGNPRGSLRFLDRYETSFRFRTPPRQGLEHLPCNEPFQAAHDLSLAAAFPYAPSCPDLCLLVPAQPHDGDAVERGIGLAVATTIEAVPDGLARTGRQGAEATEGRQG